VQLAKAYIYSICLHQNDHQFQSTRGSKSLYPWIVKVNKAEPGFTLGIISNEGKIKEIKFLLAADIKQTKLKLYYTKNVI